MRYQLVRRIPTMAGSRVEVARDRDGRLVVVKRGTTEAARRDLERYATQLRRLAEIPRAGAHYPPVLSYQDNTLVLPYYPHGSVDAAAAGDPQIFRALVRRSVGALLTVSGCAELVEPDHPLSGVDGARTFWRDELVRRYDRLTAALAAAGSPEGLAGRALTPIRRWLPGDALDGLLRRAVRRPLALAAHGDFGLNNVLLAAPAAADAGVRFIDLRGALPWAGGTPYWDPMLDLGTLVAFHCHIEPALGIRDGVAVTGDRDRATLDPEEMLALCGSVPELPAWAERDPEWRLRLRLGVLIRILGSVSTQLTAAPTDRIARAYTVAGLLKTVADDLASQERVGQS